MVTIKEMTSVEYGSEFESLQLLEGDCLRLDDSELPPIKNISCSGNDLKKLLSRVKSIREDKFIKKYVRRVEITNVYVQN